MSGSGSSNWGLPDQFSLSPEELRLVDERKRRRVALKNEFQRIFYNPYKNMKVEGGQPFDPALQRFASTRADYYHYFKPNKKNFAVFLLMWAIPVGLLTWITGNQRWAFEARCRNAEIPWRYRSRKFD